MNDDVLAELAPTPVRRLASLAVLLLLGAMVVYLGLAMPSISLFWRLVLLAIGAGVLVIAQRLYQATGHAIILTRDALRDSGGRQLCKLDDIVAVERGAFAFKPSHGFLIRTKTRGGRAWAPGLWWRFGTRIGVGGATPAGQAKFMAEMLAAAIHDKQQNSGSS